MPSHPTTMTSPLYSPDFEHDSCGVGLVADLAHRSSHSTVEDALTILENLEHRGATGADPNSGDGAGILIKIPDGFLRSVTSEFAESLPPEGQYGVGIWMLEVPDVYLRRKTINCRISRRG